MYNSLLQSTADTSIKSQVLHVMKKVAPNSVYSHYEKKSYFSPQIHRDKKTVPFHRNQL